MYVPNTRVSHGEEWVAHREENETWLHEPFKRGVLGNALPSNPAAQADSVAALQHAIMQHKSSLSTASTSTGEHGSYTLQESTSTTQTSLDAFVSGESHVLEAGDPMDRSRPNPSPNIVPRVEEDDEDWFLLEVIKKANLADVFAKTGVLYKRESLKALRHALLSEVGNMLGEVDTVAQPNGTVQQEALLAHERAVAELGIFDGGSRAENLSNGMASPKSKFHPQLPPGLVQQNALAPQYTATGQAFGQAMHHATEMTKVPPNSVWSQNPLYAANGTIEQDAVFALQMAQIQHACRPSESSQTTLNSMAFTTPSRAHGFPTTLNAAPYPRPDSVHPQAPAATSIPLPLGFGANASQVQAPMRSATSSGLQMMRMSL